MSNTEVLIPKLVDLDPNVLAADICSVQPVPNVEYISEVSQDIQPIDHLEREEILNHYMNQYVFFKDVCFDILEKKITIDQLAQVLHGFDRGHDA
jgi:hypothetical protein